MTDKDLRRVNERPFNIRRRLPHRRGVLLLVVLCLLVLFLLLATRFLQRQHSDGPWDVDNDGDWTFDSIWLEIDMPVKSWSTVQTTRGHFMRRTRRPAQRQCSCES